MMSNRKDYDLSRVLRENDIIGESWQTNAPDIQICRNVRIAGRNNGVLLQLTYSPF